MVSSEHLVSSPSEANFTLNPSLTELHETSLECSQTGRSHFEGTRMLLRNHSLNDSHEVRDSRGK